MEAEVNAMTDFIPSLSCVSAKDWGTHEQEDVTYGHFDDRHVNAF
jgi:hypothetical protein